MKIEDQFVGKKPETLSDDDRKLYCRLIVRGTLSVDEQTGLITHRVENYGTI